MRWRLAGLAENLEGRREPQLFQQNDGKRLQRRLLKPGGTRQKAENPKTHQGYANSCQDPVQPEALVP
jgi:hypothetical protein